MSFYNRESTLVRGMSKLLNNSVMNNSVLNNSSYSNQRVTVNRNDYNEGMNRSYQLPRVVTLDFYDTGMANSSIFQRNFSKVVESLNALEPVCKWNANYFRRPYIQEISEPCIVINNEHCMVNDTNFKIFNTENFNDIELEKSAKFLHQSIKLTTNWVLQNSYY